jgi:endonuclease III
MLHTIEDLIHRINLMKDKAIMLHRLRNEFAEISYKEYDKATCNQLLADIQGIARGIANDTQGDEIKTEMDEWKK